MKQTVVEGSAGVVMSTPKYIDPRSILTELKNPLASYELADFFTNHKERLKRLKKENITTDNIFEYLQVLTSIEQEADVTAIKVTPSISYKHVEQTYTKVTMTNGKFKELGWNPTYYFFAYKAKRLPFCCGVTEYGEFQFHRYEKVISNLVYNLLIDLMRIEANNKRSWSGAVGLINYFSNTEFGIALDNRDDLNFIKEFVNPKTSAKLKTYIFDTKI